MANSCLRVPLLGSLCIDFHLNPTLLRASMNSLSGTNLPVSLSFKQKHSISTWSQQIFFQIWSRISLSRLSYSDGLMMWTNLMHATWPLFYGFTLIAAIPWRSFLFLWNLDSLIQCLSMPACIYVTSSSAYGKISIIPLFSFILWIWACQKPRSKFL